MARPFMPNGYKKPMKIPTAAIKPSAEGFLGKPTPNQEGRKNEIKDKPVQKGPEKQ